MKKELGSAARQRELAGKEGGWMMAEATGKRFEWAARATGMAPN
jgi:hypothetical protein